MIDLHRLTQQINSEIATLRYGDKPAELYDPIRYLMQLGGKRLRPVLAMLSAYLFDNDTDKALRPAIAVEVFHNFTLMHDDIMDAAPLRRGLPTVHEKWNTNVAILSGDVMLVNAYELLLEVEPAKLKTILRLFNRCAAEVCEGQQFDMNFESLDTVTEADYLEMIKLKTAVLLGFSAQLGGIIGGGSDANTELLREFGTSIGIGFQLKDDLLDVYGDKEKFGKQVGGDIIANKKTFLLINALEKAQGHTAEALQFWLKATNFDKEEKVKAVTDIYDRLQIKALTEQRMNSYFEQGFAALEKVDADAEKKALLAGFAQQLIGREK